MTGDPTLLLILASTAVAGLSLTTAAGLKVWQGLLDLRKQQIGSGGHGAGTHASGELRALRDRVRRLEAIASGTDL